MRVQPHWSRQQVLGALARMQRKSADLVGVMLNAPNQWSDGQHMDVQAMWIDPFRASYSCPVQEKVGRLQDGGKWVCSKEALLSRPGCVVYSVGSKGDTSFERAILNETACEVFTFDPTLNATEEDAVRRVPNLHFHSIGLSHRDGEHAFGNVTKPVLTLHAIMNQFKHPWIDVLKVDIEGHEWQVLGEWLKTHEALPFTQLLIEVHLVTKPGHPPMNPTEAIRMLEGLQSLGMHTFHVEENNYCADCKGMMYELAFIQLDEQGRVVVGGMAGMD